MRGWMKQGLGVIWLEEVTMRYGGEEGRLFDTAIRWYYAVMYNGNTSELAESRMRCTNYTIVHTRTVNCKQIEPIGFPTTGWSAERGPVCVLGIKVSVWSLSKYHMKKKDVEDISQQNCIRSFFTRNWGHFSFSFRTWWFKCWNITGTAHLKAAVKSFWFPLRQCDCIKNVAVDSVPGPIIGGNKGAWCSPCGWNLFLEERNDDLECSERKRMHMCLWICVSQSVRVHKHIFICLKKWWVSLVIASLIAFLIFYFSAGELSLRKRCNKFFFYFFFYICGMYSL